MFVAGLPFRKRLRKLTMRKTTKTKKATLADVALAAGVGAMTVSRTINGHPYVSEETAKKVRAAKTIAEARKAVRFAISQVHKIISLQIADDRASGSTATRDGALVVETLRVADVKLEKASGL